MKPRLRKRPTAAAAAEILADANLVRQLLAGRPFFPADGFRSDDQIAAAWRLVADELLPAFIKRHPGRRPFGWWLCEGLTRPDSPEAEAEFLRSRGLLEASEN